MVKRNVFPLHSGIISVALILLQISVDADVLAQSVPKQEHQQPYASSYIDQLFTNLPASHASVPCAGKNINENGLFCWVAFYRWHRISHGLRLSINTDWDSLRYCTSLAFEELRYESFQIGFEPPAINLFYYLNDENGIQIVDEPIVYTCSVPAKTSKSDYNSGRFEDNCRVSIEN